MHLVASSLPGSMRAPVGQFSRQLVQLPQRFGSCGLVSIISWSIRISPRKT